MVISTTISSFSFSFFNWHIMSQCSFRFISSKILLQQCYKFLVFWLLAFCPLNKSKMNIIAIFMYVLSCKFVAKVDWWERLYLPWRDAAPIWLLIIPGWLLFNTNVIEKCFIVFISWDIGCVVQVVRYSRMGKSRICINLFTLWPSTALPWPLFHQL